AAILECLYRIGRVHVLVAHERARFVGADGEDRELEWAEAFARHAEMMTGAIAGIADVIDAARGRVEDESRPQRLVAVVKTALGPVAHGRECYSDVRAEFHLIVPVEGLCSDAVVPQNPVIAERHHEARTMCGGEGRKRRRIEMIVMAMRDEHGVDG